MCRYNIIKIDFTKRYIDIIDHYIKMPKQLYYELCKEHGHLWSSYERFICFKRRHLNGQTIKNKAQLKFIKEFISIQALPSSIIQRKIYENITKEYPAPLWISYTNFLKEKSRYINKLAI